MRIATHCAIFLVSACAYAAAPLSWQTIKGGARAHLPPVSQSAPGFSRIDPAAAGIKFTNVLPEARKLANANLMNGSGVALGDYDGDGLCDIYLCDLNGSNKLYRNLGDWRFQDVTEETGTTCPKQTSTGAVFADINGDGRLDLLVTSMGGPHACFLNLGGGRFTNTILQAGITSRLGATSMALADIDGNGTLDLYVANYGVTSILRSGGALNVSYQNGKPVVRGRYAQRIKIIDNMMYELGEPDTLYLNDGRGNFKAVPWTEGGFLKNDGSRFKTSEIPWDQGLSAMFRDLNGDGAPDIYVCNDAFTPDRLWLNDGKGGFHEADRARLRTMSHFSMGVDFGDLDRDGRDEFLVVDMLSREHRFALTQKGNMPPQPYVPGEFDTVWQVRRNTLQISDGCGGYSDVAYYAGVAGSEWSWSPIFLDVDLDGWEDILIANGFEHNTDDMDIQEAIHARPLGVEESRKSLARFPPLKTPNIAFHNLHNLIFQETGKAWGFDARDISNGMALADLDNDGDLDVVVNCLNAPPLLYRNNCSAPRVAVRLKGLPPNTQGIGAHITVAGGPVIQSQEVMAGGRYVSGDDPMRVFAAGTNGAPLQISVRWRDGSESTIENAEPGYVYELDQARAHASQPKSVPSPNEWFQEEKSIQAHRAEPFDDLSVQPSLPVRLSAFGPGTVVSDLNGDGYDDLVTGAGRNGSLSISLNDGRGGFKSVSADSFKLATSGLLSWPRSENETELLASLENYAQPRPQNIAAFSINRQGAVSTTESGSAFQAKGAGGPLALTEVHGEMTLFWGARFLPGRYPESAPSHLYRFRQGTWQLDTANETPFLNVGLVTSAIWSDLDADGTPELILGTEWGSLRVFSAVDSKFSEVTEKWGLNSLTGLWQSVASGDFDGDGRMDLIAGNWGLNSYYNQAPDRKVDLYFGEFTTPGRIEMIEAYFEPTLGKTVPWRDKRVLSTALPWLNEHFPTHAQFASASVAEILQGTSGVTRKLQASTLASMVLLNRGTRFEPVLLPRPAQYAPVFGIAVADFDNDGKTDVFLAQNFFAVREFDSRLDAGRGLLLRGDGRGGFEPLSPADSGIRLFGEQRGCAVGDWNRDGRTDLLVSQHASETKLFTNRMAPPGARLQLKGRLPNLGAVGAQFQVGTPAGWGPLQEVQIGSGYWSQSSLAKVLPAPGADARIRIRWPGQREWMEGGLPSSPGDYEIGEEQGTIRVLPSSPAREATAK